MASSSRRGELGTGIARFVALFRRGLLRGPVGDLPEIDRRSPEQRILDTAARYRERRPVDSTSRPRGDPRRGSTMSTTVPPTGPGDSEGPTWVRRLDDRMAVSPTLPGRGGQASTTNAADRQEPGRR